MERKIKRTIGNILLAVLSCVFLWDMVKLAGALAVILALMLSAVCLGIIWFIMWLID